MAIERLNTFSILKEIRNKIVDGCYFILLSYYSFDHFHKVDDKIPMHRCCRFVFLRRPTVKFLCVDQAGKSASPLNSSFSFNSTIYLHKLIVRIQVRVSQFGPHSGSTHQGQSRYSSHKRAQIYDDDFN